MLEYAGAAEGMVNVRTPTIGTSRLDEARRSCSPGRELLANSESEVRSNLSLSFGGLRCQAPPFIVL